MMNEETKLGGHSNEVNSVCFSPDGNTLASGSSDKSIRLWDVKTIVIMIAVCFSLDGNKLASKSGDGSIRLWAVQTGQEIKDLNNRYNEILENCTIQLLQNNPFTVNTIIPILCISQTPVFQAKEALVLNGEFINQQGQDLRSLLKSRGCCILVNKMQQ